MSESDDAKEKRELLQLEEQIEYHERAYRAGAPEIPDSAFDEMVERYSELADSLGIPEDERLDRAPGVEHTEGFETVEHRVPMLSLEKLSTARRDSQGRPIPSKEQLVAWYDRRRRELELKEGEPLRLLIEPKVDGISISLLYRGGSLDRAVTRGDGRRGDVITAQVRQTGAVPERLEGVSTGELEIRGELYWPREAFEAHNERLVERGDKPLINPRNGCAGMMKRKDPSGLEGVGIRAFLYQIPWVEEVKTPTTQWDMLHWLAELGAPVYLDEVTREPDVQAAFAHCESYDARRAELGYDIDGMVIKIDDLSLYPALGSTGHHPHWGIAYKFPPERKATRLRDIKVQVGKSGKLTPVAELEPVFVAGTTVSRASLHNFVELERKDVRIGDRVFVEKAGEIIPQVVGVDLDAREESSAPFPRPTECPSCGSEVVSEEIFIFCPNPACPAQIRERLQHFASRKAMDIEGLGPALVDQVVDHLGIRSPDELFFLRPEVFEGLERMGKKSAENVCRSLDEAKSRGLARVLVGLSIRYLGEAMAEELAAHFETADALLDFATRYAEGDPEAVEEVAPESASARGAIEGLAKKTADIIFGELASSGVKRVFRRLGEAGVDLRAQATQKQELEGIAGKTFVLTGTLPTLRRAQASQMIKEKGGKVTGSVSKKTDYLVAGEEAGSKLDKAKKLEVPILDEAQLLELLSG